MNKDLYCLGCGAIIQTKDKEQAGYVPASALKTRDDVLCRRCFRLKHYNETEDIELTADDFHQMISDIRLKEGIIIHMVDLFDVEGSLIGSLPRMIGNKDIILVGNKIDLLPKSTNKRKLSQWLRRTANEVGMKVKDVCLISSTKGIGLEELKYFIEKYRERKDVYIVGTTNVGKSTLINRLIQDTVGEEDVITTSYFPGTTLGFIEIPLDDSSSLIDTPGIVNERQIVHYVSNQDLKKITPKNEIKPRTYQLREGQTLFLGGIARFDIISGEDNSYICYFSNELKIHRTPLDNADKLYREHLGKLLSPPNKKTMKQLPEFTKNTFKITEDFTDVVIPGLGWITIKHAGVTVTVHYPKSTAVSLREAFTKDGR